MPYLARFERVEVALTPSDQAQFLFYLSPTEWVKVGVEYDNDALWCGVVVCNPYSDWYIVLLAPISPFALPSPCPLISPLQFSVADYLRSIQPPPSGPTVFTISYNPSTTTLRVYLNDTMMREVKSFGMYSAGGGDGRPSAAAGGNKEVKAPEEVLAEKEVWIGAMACSPLGSVKEGEMAKATFKGLQVREGTR